jgi:membrane-associated protein
VPRELDRPHRHLNFHPFDILMIDLLLQLKDMILHFDVHLEGWIRQLGPWIYVLMFAVIFCETGLVVTPFLPGDSLLFALGAYAAKGALSLPVLLVSLIIAAILGDTLNYWIGAWLGPRIFRGEKIRFLNPKHLERTHEFFERYGGKTIIIARFAPIVRTFAPFVAGMGKMTYRRFMAYNVIGGVVWITLFLFAGYWFGNLPAVQKNFKLVILGIIFVSILPGVFEFWRERRRLRELSTREREQAPPG